MNRFVIIAIVVLRLSWPGVAAGQSAGNRFELGVQLPVTMSSEFEKADAGVGGRFSWHPARVVGIEAEGNVYPANFPNRVAFSRGRVEGLFGVTLGPRFNRVRPFGRLRSGFVRFRDAPQPLACILIYPPPLSCVLASGRTMPAIDIGGGVEVFATPMAFLRADVGDRLLRYPGPAFDHNRTAHTDAFVSHDFRIAIGGGVRF